MAELITKEKIADWAAQIADFAESLAHQITSHTKDSRDLESVFFYTKLIRHSMLMNDVANLLLSNHNQRLGSSFILLRCMLEDFITIYYLKVNGYKPEFFIKNNARGISDRFKMMEETADINERFYNGSMEGLISHDYVQNEKNKLLSNQENNLLFDDRSKFKFKQFPGTREMIKSLPITDSTIANVPSLISWTHYSEYVHHSIISARGDADPNVVQVQIKQMKGTMLYAYKLIEFIKQRLEERQFPIQPYASDSLVDELTANTLDGSKLWSQQNPK